ncbi:sugar ABC transporter ATP-binding protein [Novosphingobium rosa]|uniref:sugar ABC transporter ATP-binding protein n=1 Tax=Novosphingobium rosa TaxID=76978 RepID=UPI00082D67B0|nr:sugar ABC transporter ATP-binding protein [Novosphingobium rosa]
MVSPLLSLDGIGKCWPNGTAALRGVEASFEPGRVHGLLGANGAGKSTLIKILSGAESITAGQLIWQGEPRRWRGPRDARAAGIATIYQHIPLVPTLSARDNMLLEQRGLWRDASRARQEAARIVAALGHPFPLDATVADLPIGARQMVAIAQALMGDPQLVIMDEPTASLAGDERVAVYHTVRRLAAEGRTVLFVSHFLDEIVALTDTVTVLRDGKVVLRAETGTLDEAAIAAAIAGRSVAMLERPPERRATGAPVLEIRDLASPGRLAPLSFTLHAGEIVGVAGMLGSGRSELLHAIFGDDPRARGQVLLDGRAIGRSTQEAVAAGLALVPEDRARQGYVGPMSLAENMALPAGGLLIDDAAEAQAAQAAIDRLAIKAPGIDATPAELSGGNAQKVVIAKWLTARTRVLLLDEPTAGIDIGARTDILRLVRKLADDGLPVLIVSSEPSELLAICDRILILRDGALVADVDPAEQDEAGLIQLAGGSAPMERNAA